MHFIYLINGIPAIQTSHQICGGNTHGMGVTMSHQCDLEKENSLKPHVYKGLSEVTFFTYVHIFLPQ